MWSEEFMNCISLHPGQWCKESWVTVATLLFFSFAASGASVIERQNLSCLHTCTHTLTFEGWSHISGSWERGVFVYCLHDHMRTCVQRATHIDLDQREPWKEAQRQNVSPRLYPSILPQKNGGFEEALWREVYHLESLKTKCGMSYGPEVESKWRKGKISQHSWQFFTEI